MTIKPTVVEEMNDQPKYDQSVPPWMYDGEEAFAYEAYQDHLEAQAQEFLLRQEHEDILETRRLAQESEKLNNGK